MHVHVAPLERDGHVCGRRRLLHLGGILRETETPRYGYGTHHFSMEKSITPSCCLFATTLTFFRHADVLSANRIDGGKRSAVLGPPPVDANLEAQTHRKLLISKEIPSIKEQGLTSEKMCRMWLCIALLPEYSDAWMSPAIINMSLIASSGADSVAPFTSSKPRPKRLQLRFSGIGKAFASKRENAGNPMLMLMSLRNMSAPPQSPG